MENTIKTFTLFVRSDEKSHDVADALRTLNAHSSKPLKETDAGDLIIAIGGDGTFIDAVTSTKFNKSKIYTGVHTGTLGFLQNISKEEVFALIKYISFEDEIPTRKIFVSSVAVNLLGGETLKFHSLNEVLISGADYSRISFAEHINGELLQNVSGNGIIVATDTGDTAYSMNAGGAIDFSTHFQLVCTLDTPIRNASYERFITNPVICTKVSIVLKPADNIRIIIDGTAKDIDSAHIQSVDVSLDGSNYINQFALEQYSKIKIIREKILGYNS